MKKIMKTMLAAAAMTVMGAGIGECMAQGDSLKVKITNIKTFTGTIMVAAGDFSKPMEMASAMVAADGESVECVLKGKIDPGTNLYVFHDENGNFNLDMKDGIPAEGCFKGIVETDETGTATVELKYYSAALPAKE